ncbi:MAG: PAS domain S-box protein [Candidatus Aenigmatarchaeota archaeon]
MVEAEILVVEDEMVVAEDIKESLKDIGHRVVGITSRGEKAIELAREKVPDLILMDIVLKGEIDGVEAAEKIGSEFDIPIIYLTAYSDDKRLERAKVTEPYGYILKPYRKRELASNIEMALYKQRMEKKLKESEKKYRAIFENTGTAMAIIEENKTISMANDEVEKLTGYPKEELEGEKKWTELVSGSDLDRMEKYHRERRENLEEIPERYNFTLINKFGDAREVIMQVGMMPDDKKSIVSLIDVTEERKRFETMRESQEAFRRLFERSFDAVAVVGQEGKCKEVNDNFCELFGYPENTLSNKECSDLLKGDDAEKFEEHLDLMFKRELEEKSLEVTGMSQDGEDISLKGRLALVTDFEDKPLYVIWNIDKR